LLERFHIGADVEKVRALVFRIHVVAIFDSGAVEVDGWQYAHTHSARWFQRCRRPDTTAVEDIDPQVAPFEFVVEIQVARAQIAEGDVVCAIVEDAAALDQRVSIDAVVEALTVQG